MISKVFLSVELNGEGGPSSSLLIRNEKLSLQIFSTEQQKKMGPYVRKNICPQNQKDFNILLEMSFLLPEKISRLVAKYFAFEKEKVFCVLKIKDELNLGCGTSVKISHILY